MTSPGPVWLLTGARGQLGTSLRSIPLPGGAQWLVRGHAELDVGDERQVARELEQTGATVVVNAAAFTQVDRCEEMREAAWQANALAPGILAKHCAGRALLVHVSTEYVFSGRAHRPIPEDAPTEPASVYGESKVAGERAIQESGCEHLIIRTQWLFGSGHNFVRTILGAGRAGKPLRVVEDQLGRPTATDPLARAIVAAVEAGMRDVVHLACEGIASWYDFARQVIEQGAERGLTSRVPVEPVGTQAFPRPATRPAYGVLALDRARAQGIHMPHWSEALRTYLDQEARRDA